MGRPRSEDIKTSTPERILLAAEREFSDAGFAQAKLADIAARAGIRRPSLLYHFKSKEELYQATVQQAFTRLGAALMEAMQAEGTFEERILDTAERYAAFIGEHRVVARLVLRELLDAEGPGPGNEILMNQVAPLVDTVERFIESAGASTLSEGAPVRARLMCIASTLIMRSAANEVRDVLWGSTSHARDLTRALMLREPAAGGSST